VILIAMLMVMRPRLGLEETAQDRSALIKSAGGVGVLTSDQIAYARYPSLDFAQRWLHPRDACSSVRTDPAEADLTASKAGGMPEPGRSHMGTKLAQIWVLRWLMFG
jgi:hypothetical protein